MTSTDFNQTKLAGGRVPCITQYTSAEVKVPHD